MKKKIELAIALGLAVCAAAFSYNPPVQGENLLLLAQPEMLSGGASSAGGGILSVTPSSVALNPALPSLEERFTFDLGYTGFINHSGIEKYGQAFSTGAIIPTDWMNFAAEFEGILSPLENMNLGNSVNLRMSASKQILDKLYVGVGVGGGILWGYRIDWMLSADIGAVYNFGTLGFMKSFRIAASANNLGKVYNGNTTIGASGVANEKGWRGFPYFSTFRTGAAAEFIDTENFKLGLSLDVTTPLFQNLIVDTGVQFEFFNLLKIYSSWEFNLFETIHNRQSWLPTVGLVAKINFGSGFMKNEKWERSEISPSIAWKNVDWNVNLVSAGAVLRLGELDTTGPDIEIGN